MHFSNLMPLVGLTASLFGAVEASPVDLQYQRRSLSLSSRLSRKQNIGRPSRIRETPEVPLAGATAELPSPVNVTLVYVALGRGVQNYTCASSTDADTPVSIGAVASLFDITSEAYNSDPDLDSLPACAVYEPIPTGNTFSSSCGTFKLLGNHYFNSSATPTFNLSTVQDVLWGKKTADVAAPSDSDMGPAGTGPVDWLQLQDKGGSIGLTEVYRVETAGGNPPTTCANQSSVVSVQYAAEYWFYK